MPELNLTSFSEKFNGGAPIFFSHIPKTTGSTFVEFFRKYHQETSSFWYSEDQRAAFLNESLPEESTKYRISGGHFPLYEAIRRINTKTLFLSFIRHPVDRIVSYYNFSRVTHTENLTSSAAREMDLKSFLHFLEKQRPRILKNQQCRYLSGMESLNDQLDISFSKVRHSWQNKEILILPSNLCAHIIKLLSRLLDSNDRIEITNAKVNRVNESKAIDNECVDIILKNNEADLELFNAHCHIADTMHYS